MTGNVILNAMNGLAKLKKMFGGRIKVYGKKAISFQHLEEILIRYQGHIWIAERGQSESKLIFRPMSRGRWWQGGKLGGQYRGGVAYLLKRWRKRKDLFRPTKDGYGPLTQIEAAKELGVTQTLISKIEKGRRKLSMQISERIHKDFARARHDSATLI